VGAAKREITAPPGYPTGGHGPAGSIARGSWNRNWARAFVFRDGGGAVAVLVSCDTFAIPLSLTKHVWDAIKDKPELKGMRPEGLLISATHTHQGAGNYMDVSAYNAFGSARGGFSRPLFDFLATQITAAVTEAAGRMQPATVRLYQGKLKPPIDEPFLVNRSPVTFAQVWDAPGVLDELGDFAPDKACPELQRPSEPTEGWDLGGCPRLRAVDRRLLVLEAKDANAGAPIAQLVFFASHPIVLIHTAPHFNSDFTGVAMDALERKTPSLVAGLFNGAEGDITPRRFYRDVLEVVERGQRLTESIQNVLARPDKMQVLDPKLAVRARLINTGSTPDRSCSEGNISGRLAAVPQPGAAQVGGAELDRTIFFDFGWKTGVKSFTAANGQGNKQPALDLKDLPGIGLLTAIFSGGLAFPSRLPVTYLKLGSFSLGAVPFEMSTTAGYRIRKDAESSGEVFQLLGLTNGYASYTATASEYAAQDYMGASTLWGPEQAEFIRCQFAKLRSNSPSPDFSLPSTILGLTDPFSASIIGEPRDLPDEDLEEIVRDKYHMPVRNLPFFEWSEAVPRTAKYTAAGRKIYVTSAAGVADDTDVGFIKILKQAPKGDCQIWDAIWLGPLLQQVGAADYVFHVKTADHKTVTSVPFPLRPDSPLKPAPVAIANSNASCN